MSVPLATKPMEAEPVDDLPRGKGWLYEPKYDGFRCLAFRDGDKVAGPRSLDAPPYNKYYGTEP